MGKGKKKGKAKRAGPKKRKVEIEASDKKFIGYCRVSTDEQGQKGHGLSAQKKAIKEFFGSHLNGTLLDIKEEVASGKRISRPLFDYVLAVAKRERATVIVAKLDRIGRSLGVLAKVQGLGVPFLCADAPNDSEMITGIKMVFAQEERRLIGERTRAALSVLKEKGKKLGWHNPKIRKKVLKKFKAKRTALAKRKSESKIHHRVSSAKAFSESLRPLFKSLIQNGQTVRGIVNYLNEEAVATPTGKGLWHIGTTAAALKRLGLSTRRLEDGRKIA